jgi:hypothetical protein
MRKSIGAVIFVLIWVAAELAIAIPTRISDEASAAPSLI